MKIYFSASISQMNDRIRNNCVQIINELEKAGHKILSKKFLDQDPSSYVSQSEDESLDIQRNLTKYKKQADIIVFEVSKQSLGIGQELALSLSLNKPVIALFEKGVKPHVLRDEGGDLLLLCEYTLENLSKDLEEAINYSSNYQDVRFNFFISPAISHYLDWISQNKKIPRSVYLRNMIEEDMEQNQEYQEGR